MSELDLVTCVLSQPMLALGEAVNVSIKCLL